MFTIGYCLLAMPKGYFIPDIIAHGIWLAIIFLHMCKMIAKQWEKPPKQTLK